jgi:hypothetical protein
MSQTNSLLKIGFTGLLCLSGLLFSTPPARSAETPDYETQAYENIFSEPNNHAKREILYRKVLANPKLRKTDRDLNQQALVYAIALQSRFDEALKLYKKFYPERGKENFWEFLSINAYFTQEISPKSEDLIVLIEKNMQLKPHDLDYCFMMIDHFLEQKKPDKVIKLARRALLVKGLSLEHQSTLHMGISSALNQKKQPQAAAAEKLEGQKLLAKARSQKK